MSPLIHRWFMTLESPQTCSSAPTVQKATSPVCVGRAHATTLPPIPEEDSSDEEDAGSDASDVYSAEQIVRHRIRNGRPQFLIKWSGFPES